MTTGVVVALVAAGGTGAVARFVVDGALQPRLRPDFPWATLLINVTGSLLVGVLTGLTLYQGSPDSVRAVVGTGFCGGYTTFSTASVEAVRLARAGRPLAAIASLLASSGLTLAAAAVGIALTRM